MPNTTHSPQPLAPHTNPAERAPGATHHRTCRQSTAPYQPTPNRRCPPHTALATTSVFSWSKPVHRGAVTGRPAGFRLLPDSLHFGRQFDVVDGWHAVGDRREA